MNQQGVIVIGAGGHGKVVVATLQAVGRSVVEVWDDDREKSGGELLGVPVVGSIADRIAGAEGREAVLGIGDNRIRRRFASELPLTWISAVHPSAVVHPSVRPGEGTVVFAGAVVQPDAVLGRHAIVNTGATVDHDGELGDFVRVAPGVHLAGEVSVGEGAVLGIGDRQPHLLGGMRQPPLHRQHVAAVDRVQALSHRMSFASGVSGIVSRCRASASRRRSHRRR